MTRLAAMRVIDHAVMVEIVLAVMFLGVDTTTLDVLRVIDLGTLLASHNTVSLGACLHVANALLAAFETIGFALGKAARGNALFDAALLIGFALIDTRCIVLSEGERRQGEGKYGDDLDDFHVYLLMVRANSLDVIRK
jgi:hypothetical protein